MYLKRNKHMVYTKPVHPDCTMNIHSSTPQLHSLSAHSGTHSREFSGGLKTQVFMFTAVRSAQLKRRR